MIYKQRPLFKCLIFSDCMRFPAIATCEQEVSKKKSGFLSMTFVGGAQTGRVAGGH